MFIQYKARLRTKFKYQSISSAEEGRGSVFAYRSKANMVKVMWCCFNFIESLFENQDWVDTNVHYMAMVMLDWITRLPEDNLHRQYIYIIDFDISAGRMMTGDI